MLEGGGMIHDDDDDGVPFLRSTVFILRLKGTGRKMGFGEYPAEFNPKVHGPYDPARFYGKGKDTL